MPADCGISEVQLFRGAPASALNVAEVNRTAVMSEECALRKVRAAAAFIQDPLGKRELGMRRLQVAVERHERLKHLPELTYTPRSPRMPTDALDEGLIFASRADLINAQAVTPIERLARSFIEWLVSQPRRPGPEPDVEQAVELFLAVQVVAAIRRKRGHTYRPPRTAEVRDVLLLLFGRAATEANVKKRLQRHRGRSDEFQLNRRASADSAVPLRQTG